jgi:hypothetical protein
MVFNSSTYQTGPWSNTDSAATPTAAVNLQTPSIEATAVNSFTAQITWTNVPNESNYTLERSNDGNIWTLLATLAPNVTTYSDPTLPANFIVWYRVRANGNGSTFLTSGYGTDTTKTPPEEEGATKFGLISTPNESGLQQFVISSNTADSLTMCVVRSAWTASVNTVGNIKTLSEGGKEIILNVNNMQANQGRNFTLDEERAAFVYQVDTLIRRQLIGRNVHILVVNNEENNTGYRELDTVPNSPTNSAKLYFNNEVRVVDSIAKAVGNGQFKVTPGGLTGKNMYWFTWRNLMDSGKVAEAAELAYQVFPPAERRNLATYDKDNVSITMIKQLIPLYKTAAFNYINVHIKTPLNGIDSTHIDPNVVAYTLWAWHNLTGKEVGSNEVGAKSIVPAISAELVQAGMDGKVPFWILYDGEGTVTTPLPSGIDVSLRDATGKALNDIGKAVATKLMQIQEDSQ